ncbi:response regulator [Cupriavidus sp. AU9028]|nr:response regulator [Cupriavidus sp. AU9028]
MNATPVIAIVDDDASVLQAMGRLVRSFGLAVELHDGGAELLASPTIDQIACVVTDVQMPRMSGLALFEALRMQGRQMPVIFMTAFSREGVARQARAAGAVCFLDKPFQDTELLACIERALAAGRSAPLP